MSGLDARMSETNQAWVRAESGRLPRRAAILLVGGASLMLWGSVAATAARLVG
jgi:hypothetical protein